MSVAPYGSRDEAFAAHVLEGADFVGPVEKQRLPSGSGVQKRKVHAGPL